MNKIANIQFFLLKIIFILILGFPISIFAENSKQLIDNILQKKGYQAISITIKNGFLYVDALVNKNPSLAIIDTGSADINITKKTAEKLNIPVSKIKKNTGVDMYGEKSFENSVVLPNIIIGNIELKNVTANIFQHVLSENIPTLVIGSNFLRQHHAIIDIENHTLYLGQKKLSPVEMNRIQEILSTQQLQEVPLMFLGSGNAVIPLQINQSLPVNFLLDTGTGITLLSQDYLNELHLENSKGNRIIIEKFVMNPLNLSFQPKIYLNNISVQSADLTVLEKYLYVQGIFGLSEMIKAHAVIFLEEGVIYFRSDRSEGPSLES